MVNQPRHRETVQAVLATAILPHLSVRDAIEALMGLMTAISPRLASHGIRTAQYAVTLAKAAGLDSAEFLPLHWAGLLHDIGTLTLPDDLLHKESPLTAEEYALVQSHPRAGAELLAVIPSLQIAAVWIAHHHERWDGCGYPYGLRGPFIPIGSRILAVADTFDALATARCSAATREPRSALRLLQVVAGSQLDPELVELFLSTSSTASQISLGRDVPLAQHPLQWERQRVPGGDSCVPPARPDPS